MKYQIYTLGCKVNEYESQVIKNLLEKNGYQESENPDICIVNTCTVTNNADSKSRKAIRSLKRKYPSAILIAIGCMIQNKKDQIDNLPIDIALGNQDKSKIIEYIKNYNHKIKNIKDMNIKEFEDMKLENSDLTRAYIKIQDGCNNYCSYCIIPYVRGNIRSKKKEKIIKEVKDLVNKGHREIVLTGIHTGHYKDNQNDLSDLLKELEKIEKLKRIRISSIEITELNNKFLNTLKSSKKIVNHMHIPLQSGSDEILEKMNRKYNTKYFINKINKIRNIRPNINITTDVIVGFPNETNQNFEETIKTIKKTKITKIHVFPYSKRDGTKAAIMPNQIDSKTKKERTNKLIEVSKQNEIKYMENNLNKDTSFIPETYSNGYLYGHTENFLAIKAKGDKKLLKQNIKIKTKKIKYPYIISEIDKQVSK